MKTTIDLPSSTLQRATDLAAAQGISVEQLLSKALQEKLRASHAADARSAPPWLKNFGVFGKTAAMRTETDRIQKLIDDEFERIEPDDRE